MAGGAKCLASPESEGDRIFILEQIRKSMRLHGTKRVILMVHSDCGAYGGLAGGFRAAMSKPRLRTTSRNCVKERAASNLLAEIPSLDVQGYFVDFEGIWDTELGSASSRLLKKEPTR